MASAAATQPASVSFVCAAAPAPVTSVPFIAMKRTPLVCGAGVGVGADDELGGGDDDDDVCPPVTDGAGLSVAALVPASEKPLDRMARPRTIKETMRRA